MIGPTGKQYDDKVIRNVSGCDNGAVQAAEVGSDEIAVGGLHS